jgi:hypothetical protein
MHLQIGNTLAPANTHVAARQIACDCEQNRLFYLLPNFARACGRVSIGGHPDKRPDSRLRK